MSKTQLPGSNDCNFLHLKEIIKFHPPASSNPFFPSRDSHIDFVNILDEGHRDIIAKGVTRLPILPWTSNQGDLVKRKKKNYQQVFELVSIHLAD